MNLILKEIKLFSKQNWWIYILFIISLFIIYKTNSWSLIEVALVFMFHFFWDICVMMMWDFYSKKQEKKALYAQIWSFVIFWLIWIYAWITSDKWSYLVPQILFFWPIIKWFKPKFKWLNSIFMLWVWIIVLILYYYLWLIHNITIFIQILWFIIFPISLIIENNKVRYFWSLLWIFLIFLGSSFMLYNWFNEWKIIWTDLSYTLLPFTVFIYYLKLIKNYI